MSTLTDLLRDNLKKSKIKRFVLPTLGEFLYLIASQVESACNHQYDILNYLYLDNNIKLPQKNIGPGVKPVSVPIGCQEQGVTRSSFAVPTAYARYF